MSNKIWGVNGHPFTQEAYKNTLHLQLQLIKELNLKYYRADISVDVNGKVPGEREFLSLLSKFNALNVKILPVIIFTIPTGGNYFAKGFHAGKSFIDTYKNQFNYYELGNEVDNILIKSAEFDGTDYSSYNEAKAPAYLNYLKGFSTAIKTVQSSSHIIIDASWIHYGFFSLLRLYGVPYDIIGLHWYSDMGDLDNIKNKNIFNFLYSKYHKFIWMTEFNIRNGSENADQKKDGWLARNLLTFKINKYARGLFIYELLDEPAFERSSPNEAHYGLVSLIKGQNTLKKNLFFTYKAFIATP